MRFWWSCRILPATSPSSTSHTSTESTYSRLTTSTNGKAVRRPDTLQGQRLSNAEAHTRMCFMVDVNTRGFSLCPSTTDKEPRLYARRLCLLSFMWHVCVGRTAWVQKIKAASEEFIETEKSKRERVYQGLSPLPRCLADGDRRDDTGWTDLRVSVVFWGGFFSTISQEQRNRPAPRHHSGGHRTQGGQTQRWAATAWWSWWSFTLIPQCFGCISHISLVKSP